MTKEELKEYCKKVMEEEHKQAILNFMIEIETLKLINKNLQSKIDQQDQIIREAREYVKEQIEYLKGQQDDFDYDKTIKTYCKGKLVTLNRISEILDRNVK